MVIKSPIAKRAGITAPAPAPARRAPAREVFYTTTRLASDGYDSWHVEERKITRRLNEATLVSSQTVAGTHAPALDVDFPTVLTMDSQGQVTVWVDAPLRRRAFTRLLKLMAEFGIGVCDVPDRRALRLAARRAAYATDAAHAANPAARTAVLRTRGADLGATFEEALDAASQASGTGRPFQAPAMANPWPLRLQVAADVVESSSTGHHHLFLDTELTWPAYVELLRAAGRAKLLEKGYVRISVSRKATHLRLPWVAK